MGKLIVNGETTGTSLPFFTLVQTDPGVRGVLVVFIVLLVLLILVRLLHMRVTRNYLQVKGFEGLADEEKEAKRLKARQAALEEAIRGHEAAIRRDRNIQAFMGKLLG
ncbi:MAG: hypothetical protein IJ088_04090 [Clostridia bacterium]|nr:hypothetical protein [Clostridia bacterium]